MAISIKASAVIDPRRSRVNTMSSSSSLNEWKCVCSCRNCSSLRWNCRNGARFGFPGIIAAMNAFAGGPKCVAAPTTTIACTRSGADVAIWSKVIPPELAPIAATRSKPSRPRAPSTSTAAARCVYRPERPEAPMT